MASSDFTNIRIESNDPQTVTIRYSYGSTNGIKVYRSTDGSSYSAVITIPAAYGSYPSPLVDIDLTQATHYFYKFSDDNGSTFTSVYDVTTQTQFADRFDSDMALPTFTNDEDVTAQNLDELRTQVESVIENDVMKPQKTCFVCPVDGALVLDCKDGCFTFKVRQDDMSDVNSISINCDSLEVILDIPEGTQTEICGFPPASGFSGDECFQAPVSSKVDLPIRMILPQPCEDQKIYYTDAPCKADYVYECFLKGSISRSTARKPSAIDCACGSFFDGLKNEDQGYSFTAWSGKQTGLNSRDHKPMAGINILYKSHNSSCFGAPGSPKIIEMLIGGFSGGDVLTYRAKGLPIWGFAVNVPENVTVQSFTGNVLLFDYPNSRFLWGSYSSADLSAGAMPTLIDSMAMSVITPTQIKIIIDGTAGNTYSSFDVVLENNADTQTMAHTAISLITEPIGFGLIWVANNSQGDHYATVDVGYEYDMLWW